MMIISFLNFHNFKPIFLISFSSFLSFLPLQTTLNPEENNLTVNLIRDWDGSMVEFIFEIPPTWEEVAFGITGQNHLIYSVLFLFLFWV